MIFYTKPKHLALRIIAFSLSVLVILMGNQLKSQNLSDTTYYRQLKNQYFQLLKDTNTTKKALRIKTKILNKLDQHGSMTAYNSAMSNQCGTFCTNPDLADWSYAGLPEYTVGLIQWNGFVNEVLANPGSINSLTPEHGIHLGTPTSGVFQYNAFLPGWENKTDPLQSPALGISKILRNPTNSSHLIASTGSDHTFDFGGGMGLITSTNNGQTWSSWSNGNNTSCYDVCKDNISGIYEHVDYLGNKSDLNDAFFLTVRKQFQDNLCAYCGTVGGIPTFTDVTPLWGQKRISDFTANEDGSVLVSTIHPWVYGTELWHGVKNGSNCGAITWTNVTVNLENAVGGSFLGSMNKFISLSESKNNIIFARTKGNQRDEIYKSTDGGLTWQMRFSNSILNAGDRSFRMLEYSEDTKLLYIGDLNLHIWDDQNQVFYTFSNKMHADVRDIDFSGINNLGQEVAYLAHDGGVSECVYDPILGLPGGMSFRPISGNTMPIAQLWGIGITQDHSGNYAVGQMHGNSFASVSGSVCKFGDGDGGDLEINPVDNSTVYFSTNSIIRKADLNSICGTFGTSLGTTSQWQFDCPLELHPNSPCLLFYGDDKSGSPSAELNIYNDCGGGLPPITPLTNVTPNSGYYMQTIGSIGLTEAAPFQVVLGSRDETPDPIRSGKLLITQYYGGGNWEDLSLSPVTNDAGVPFKDATAWLAVSDIVVSPYDQNLFFVSMQGTNQKKRVYRTQDGGLTFEDWSTGLPYVPVNNLEYLFNSRDLVIATTDAGVYYRDNTMPSWECFNENLPLVWTTDLDVNYCSDEAWATTHGRGIYKSSIVNLPRVARQHEITGTVAWNRDRVVYSDVVVKPGAELIINGALIKFAADKRILVEAGGRLQVINSELTALCENSCWEGITVEGNTSLPQNNLNKGFAFLSSSTLSHSKSALNSLGVTPDFSALDWNQMGGIFTCSNVDFLNNRRAIQFQAYENKSNVGTPIDNLCRIENCRFIINDDYRNNCGSNSPFITMNEVNGVLISGNTFRDDRIIGVTSAQDSRDGIGTTGSTFRLLSSGSGPNVFENLYRGIVVNNVTEDNSFLLRIEDATFLNNETGIRLDNVNNESHLLRNTVTVGHPLATSNFGIVLHNSSGFSVEENLVQKQSSGGVGFARGFDLLNTINPNNPAVGAYFGNNVIYNNIASGLNEGFAAYGDHVAANNIDGLEFLCNQNINNAVDFNFLDCIQPQQGSSLSPAGNTFSCGTSTAFQIASPAIGCITYHYQNGPCTATFPVSYPEISFAPTNSTPNCNYLLAMEEPKILDNQILLYPNPAEDCITIELFTEEKLSSIQVFNMQGIELTSHLKFPLLAKGLKSQIDISSLPIGGYLIKFILENNQTHTKTFLKR